MSRWKHLGDLEKNMSEKSIEELEKALRYFRQHAKLLIQPAKKLALKRVYESEKVLNRKMNG